MNAFIGLLSLLGILVGLVSIVVPLRFLKIHSRRMALIVIAACSSTFIAAAVLDSQARAPAERTKAVSASTQQALAVPTLDDGCQLAGALPNCEEEVAKITAAKATNPTSFNHPGPSPAKQTYRSSGVRNSVDDVMNKMKADEASANVKALAAQREYEAAKFRSEVANNRFESAVKKLDEDARKYKLESDSLAYDLRIREREFERKRRGY
jgi:hypothetical protein